MKNLFFFRFSPWTENQLHENQRDGVQRPTGNHTSKNQWKFSGAASSILDKRLLISRSPRQRYGPRCHQHFVGRCAVRTCCPLPQKVSWAGGVDRGTQHQKKPSCCGCFSNALGERGWAGFRHQSWKMSTRVFAWIRKQLKGLERMVVQVQWKSEPIPPRTNELIPLNTSAWIVFFFLECCVEGQTGCTQIQINMNLASNVYQTLIQSGGCDSLWNPKKVSVYVKIQRVTLPICTAYDIMTAYALLLLF